MFVFAGQLVSEFTPANPITAFEILPGGEFVVVASSGTAYPTVLRLRGEGSQRISASAANASAASDSKTTYGDGTTLEADLSSDFQDDAAAGVR